MSTSTALEEVVEQQTQERPPLQHCYCRSCVKRTHAPALQRARCGGGNGLNAEQIAGSPPKPWRFTADEERCVVCEDLVQTRQPCQRCGKRPGEL